MSKQPKTVDLECTSAFMVKGKMITPKKVVRGVPIADAENLVRRGKAKILKGDAGTESGDEKPLDELTVADLKALAQELEIEGADGMKKAELIAAIDAEGE